jgi:putative peptide zinc metalloprotease protein
MAHSVTEHHRDDNFEHAIEQVARRLSPAGLWGQLAQRADSSAAGDIYRGLARRLPAARVAGATGVWTRLAEQVDPTRYRPQAVPDVAEELVHEDGQERVVLRSPHRNYIALDALQRELWRMMDGTRTVQQLAMHVFLTQHKLMDVKEFVALLKGEGFLTDRPAGIYAALADGLEERTAEGWGQRILRTLAGARWSLPNIDGAYAAIYRTAGRLLFTALFMVVWALVVLAGLAAFTALFWQDANRRYEVLSLNGSVPLGLVALWAVLFVSFVLHESAHALAVKHFGRTLYGGGVMLYYGMPAAFVDTSDIWRSPARARMLVSAAGPMSDLFVGSLAALVAFAAPNGLPVTIGALCFKLAVACYVAVLFNANPLLELDGYFILGDLLRIPNLRARALAFVSGPLWQALRAPLRDEAQPAPADRAGKLRRWPIGFARLTHEQRILTTYGLLTAAYTLFATLAAFQFWREQLEQPIARLLVGAWWQQILGWLLLLVVVLPILGGVALAGWGLARTSVVWLVRRGYGRRPGLLSATGLSLACLIALITLHIPEPAVFWVAPMLWGVALGALLALQADYRGAAIAPALVALLFITGCSALAAGMRAFQTPYWVVPETLAFVFMLLAGFTALLDVELRFVPSTELLGTALLLMLAFAAGGGALVLAEQRWPDAARTYHIIASAPAYFGAMALALMLPRLFDLRDSRMLWPWLLLWIGILADTCAYIINIMRPLVWLDIVVAGVWAATWLIHLATLRQITPDELDWAHLPAISEEQRLVRAFELCYAGCYQVLRAVYGERRTRAFDDRMDVVAATADWGVTLDRERAKISNTVRQLELSEQGARYAEVLRYTVLMIEQLTGVVFARRTIQAAYDALPWPERETASRLCFPDAPWARDLSASFGGVRELRLRLLRQLDLLLSCDDADLEILVHALHEQQIDQMHSVLGEGQVVAGVWVVEAGEIGVWRQGKLVAELRRGAVFGDAELRESRPADASYRASMPSTLLFIPAADFQLVAQARAARASDGPDVAQVLRLLERVSLFDGVPRARLRNLARAARRHELAPRTLVVRQGRRHTMFYILAEGQAAVIKREQGAAGGAATQLVELLDPGQFFGELELLHEMAPAASVITTRPSVLLAVPHEAIRALLLGDGALVRSLEQVGSGRLLQMGAGAAR